MGSGPSEPAGSMRARSPARRPGVGGPHPRALGGLYPLRAAVVGDDGVGPVVAVGIHARVLLGRVPRLVRVEGVEHEQERLTLLRALHKLYSPREDARGEVVLLALPIAGVGDVLLDLADHAPVVAGDGVRFDDVF